MQTYGPCGTKVCRHNWHSAGSLGWSFPMLQYKHIFQIKYSGAVLSNSTRKLVSFEITNMLIAVSKIKFIVLFIIIFGTLSFSAAPAFLLSVESTVGPVVMMATSRLNFCVMR